MLVIHYTACPTDEALYTLTSKTASVSAHYLIPPEGGDVYRLVEEEKRAWHAEVSHWRESDDVNSASIGIENVNWGYTYGWVPPEPETSRPLLRYTWSSVVHVERKIGEYLPLQRQWHPFPATQIETLSTLAQEILHRWPIKPENVVGHSDIAPQRKVDPGPLFPWEQLAAKGIGVWPSERVDRVHSDKPAGISVPWMQAHLQEWGYQVPQNGMADPETRNVIAAFQMHFRPQDYKGALDLETTNILDNLLCQRKNS
jgi:N-acetylmuramoyl-L-alanine amidase